MRRDPDTGALRVWGTLRETFKIAWPILVLLGADAINDARWRAKIETEMLGVTDFHAAVAEFMKVGDRWTLAQQREYEREHERIHSNLPPPIVDAKIDGLRQELQLLREEMRTSFARVEREVKNGR